VQYSVTASWEGKISDTAKTLHRKFPGVVLLIYATNQVIGAKADNLRRDLRQKYKLNLDIRDRKWFVERVNSDPQREDAAEILATEVVDPYLASREIISHKAKALTGIECRTAFVFLGLQLEDDTREKGLTRLSFEALVRAALRDTTSERRLPRAEVHRRVQAMLPNHPPEPVVRYTDHALKHLTKNVIRHWQAVDEFCLTYEENERIRNRLGDIDRDDSLLQSEIRQAAQRELGTLPDPVLDQVASRVRHILERVLLNRGELFVYTVKTGLYRVADIGAIQDSIIADISQFPLSKEERDLGSEALNKITVEILTNPGSELRNYLRSLADAYTLMAFLRETPDVQQVVKKMFSVGYIWLDTNIVLPLLAEHLVPEDRRQFHTMIRAASEAGLELHITPGVLEEIERHMNLSLSCARLYNSVGWEGPIPFLYSLYVQTGRSRHSFPSWIEEFRGDIRPEDDIADYLRENYQVRVTSLADEANQIPDEQRFAVQAAWQEVHEEKRRTSRIGGDALLTTRLANHDIENHLGVLQKRRNERASPLGYSSWWLTLHRAAFEIAQDMQRSFGVASPIMSPDFLMNYLVLGPTRMRVPRQTERLLPIFLELRVMESISPELLAVADSVREQYRGLPEHVIRRKVRDAIDAAKARPGELAMGGLQAIEEELIRSSRCS